MQSVELEAEVARQQLEQIFASPGFARNERLSRFLRFVVERHLEGCDHELKESVIGTEVFGRTPDYNPKLDPIVRTEARRLRERLSRYYEAEGASDAVVIELPKGGYVPVIRQVARHPASIALSGSQLKRWRLAALAIAGLVLVLAGVGTRLGHRPATKTNSEAYALYRRARSAEMLPALRGIGASINLFQQAIAKDPGFAPAYAGIAAGEAARSAFDRFDAAERADMMAKGWAAARKAIELDPGLADAQEALGMMQAREAQWELAESSFRRAIEMAAGDPLWRDHFAMFLLLPLGRIEEALRQLRSAEELDPLSSQTHDLLSLTLRSAGRFDEAEGHCKKAAADDQQRSKCLAQTLLRHGDTEQALRTLEAVWSGHLLEFGVAPLGVAYARAGRREDAERLAAILPAPFEKACIFAALGDKDRTFEMLDRMVPMGPARIGREVLISPDFALLRGDPRANALRRKIGLPAAGSE